MFDASHISGKSSIIDRNIGLLALPFMIIPSYPAFFKTGPKEPPAADFHRKPVRGDLVTTRIFGDVAARPVKGPAINIRGFS